MEKFESVLCSLEVNTKYLNMITLYEKFGQDFIKFTKTRPQNYDTILKEKYEKRPVLEAFFHHNRCQKITCDEKKYKTLSASVLGLNDRDILVSALKYSFGDDIIFLNVKVIHEEIKNIFSGLIDSLRSNTLTTNRVTTSGDKYRALSTINQTLMIFCDFDLMIYIEVWYYFMFARIKNIDVVFQLHSQAFTNIGSCRYIKSSSI